MTEEELAIIVALAAGVPPLLITLINALITARATRIEREEKRKSERIQHRYDTAKEDVQKVIEFIDAVHHDLLHTLSTREQEISPGSPEYRKVFEKMAQASWRAESLSPEIARLLMDFWEVARTIPPQTKAHPDEPAVERLDKASAALQRAMRKYLDDVMTGKEV